MQTRGSTTNLALFHIEMVLFYIGSTESCWQSWGLKQNVQISSRTERQRTYKTVLVYTFTMSESFVASCVPCTKQIEWAWGMFAVLSQTEQNENPKRVVDKNQAERWDINEMKICRLSAWQMIIERLDWSLLSVNLSQAHSNRCKQWNKSRKMSSIMAGLQALITSDKTDLRKNQARHLDVWMTSSNKATEKHILQVIKLQKAQPSKY